MSASQLDLFASAPSRGFSARRDSQTQRDAAHAVNVGAGERTVLFALAKYGELTVDGIAECMNAYGPSMDRRLKALRDRGWVRATGGTALTRRNRQAALFCLTDAGRDAARAIRGSAA